VFGCAGAGFYGDGAERGGTALSEHYAVNACSVSNAEERAEILRIFYAVEGQQETRCSGFCCRVGLEEVFDGERFLRVDVGDYALMGGGLGHESQLLAGLLADGDACLPALRQQALHAGIIAFAGHQHVVKPAASGLEGFFDRVQTVQDFHEG
jgi:hypothetical protein